MAVSRKSTKIFIKKHFCFLANYHATSRIADLNRFATSSSEGKEETSPVTAAPPPACIDGNASTEIIGAATCSYIANTNSHQNTLQLATMSSGDECGREPLLMVRKQCVKLQRADRKTDWKKLATLPSCLIHILKYSSPLCFLSENT